MANFEVLRKNIKNHLAHCLKSSDVSEFHKKCVTVCGNEIERKSGVDQALRDTLLSVLSENLTETVGALESYVTLTIELCRTDLASPSMPVMLLSDMFDAMTLDKCEQLFTYVENNVTVWKEDLFFNSCKNHLLRMCNDLLRRLSRSQQTVFCGRILLFLAKFFPFSERSGVNIVSEFNVDNYTEFGNDKAANNESEPMEVESKEDNKIQIDYNLYRKFWALQDFFRNPNQCYNKVHWKVFSAHAGNVLSAFSSFKLEEQRTSLISSAIGDGTTEGAHKEIPYFAKYLTNQKLLELQLSDSNFRRYVLLQFLILFQYLNSTVKFKAETHELKPDQVEWVKSTTDQVYALLVETPPDGSAFAEVVKNILKREEHWNSWKNEGCPEFKRPAPETADGDEPKRPKRLRRRIGDVVRDAQAAGKFCMGNPELTKLWNLCPNNLEACKSKERDFLPSLETYFEEAIMQLDPAAMVEDEYKKVNDGNFGWRALRLLARRSPHFFVHGNCPISKLPEYLELMIKKIAKDRPQAQSDVKQETEETTPPESNDQEFNEDVLKQESETVDTENTDNKVRKLNPVSVEMIEKLSEVLKEDWEKLAAKLGYNSGEIEFFQGKPTRYEQCKTMLQIWSEADEDASVENLAYILEGLEFDKAVAVLKPKSD
ncbi:THO complex subunit 1 [Fopius arisanus]|uniref:THO complex subunit 1 n=1 Tax=Fopius arisanus TaxID=64838 RepID=A0A9R1TSX4_9HYME|nr:PREDICTED: THO complex subunit 1 [Fopius arisanus]